MGVGEFSASSIHLIQALGMQHPQERRVVPDADHASQEIVPALVEFLEGRYTIPTCYATLARQVFVADNLGDDTFLHFICDTLKLPEGRINTSL